MKILMITNTYFPVIGGVEQSIRSFGNEFRKRGHEVLIAAPAWKGKAEDEQHVVRVPALKSVYKTEFSVNLPVPGFFSRLMKKFLPDIVHSHHPFFMGDFALRLSRQYRIPLVFTYHIMFDKYTRYVPVLQDERAKTFIMEIATGYANLAHRVIAPCESVRDILIKRGVTAPIDVVPTGIDLQRFSAGDGRMFRQRNGISSDAVVAGYAGRIVPEKNMEFLADAMIEWLKREPRGCALIVGEGSSEEIISDLFRRAGLQDRLRFTGFLYNQDLVDAYFAMDVFAFASVSETQGMVLAEAMAAGIPVVAIDAPGSREVVRDGLNGRLIREPDRRMFAEALSWVTGCSLKEQQALKEHARITAQNFSITSCTQRMLEIYDQLRAQTFVHNEKKDNAWLMFKQRLRAEWDIFNNLMEAAGEAAVVEKSAASKEIDV